MPKRELRETSPDAMSETEEFNINISIPVRQPDPEKYQPIHVEVHLRALEGLGLRALFDGLHEGGHRFPSGEYVNRATHAVQYLLDKIGREVRERQG